MEAKGHASTIGVGCQYDPGRSRVGGIGCWCVAASPILRTCLLRLFWYGRRIAGGTGARGRHSVDHRRRLQGGQAGGLDEYQVHRHITLAMLAHAFLAVTRSYAAGGEYVPGRTHPTDRARGQTTAMPTAVAAARQSYADHPMVRLETAPPGPCHAVSLQEIAFWDFHRMRDCNIRTCLQSLTYVKLRLLSGEG